MRQPCGAAARSGGDEVCVVVGLAVTRGGAVVLGRVTAVVGSDVCRTEGLGEPCVAARRCDRAVVGDTCAIVEGAVGRGVLVIVASALRVGDDVVACCCVVEVDA